MIFACNVMLCKGHNISVLLQPSPKSQAISITVLLEVLRLSLQLLKFINIKNHLLIMQIFVNNYTNYSK